MAEGRDLAVYQGDEPDSWFAQFDFAIIQAFNEHGGANPDFAEQYANAKAAKMRFGVGAYGWAIRGANNAALGAQLRAAAPDAELGWWDDHEIGGRPAMPTAQDVEDFLDGINSPLSGYYSNLSDYIGLACPWWFANPSGNRPPRTPLIVQTGVIDGVDADQADDVALAAFIGTPAPASTPRSNEPMLISTNATLAGQPAPQVGYQLFDQGEVIAVKIDTDGGLASEYVGLVAAGLPHKEGQNPLYVIEQVEHRLFARLGRQPTDAEITAAIQA